MPVGVVPTAAFGRNQTLRDCLDWVLSTAAEAGGAMSVFEDVHANEVTGSLTMFDWLIFKGHLRRLHVAGAMRAFLWSHGVPLTNVGHYVEGVTHTPVANAERLAAEAGRPCIYLAGAVTRNGGQTEDEMFNF